VQTLTLNRLANAAVITQYADKKEKTLDFHGVKRCKRNALSSIRIIYENFFV